MVSKNEIKLISSLAQKKHRDKTGFFVAEGNKVINEFKAEGFKLKNYFSVEENAEITENTIIISEAELKKISFQKSPNTSLAIFEIPKKTKNTLEGLILVLDTIQDPGNLGTIIRLCDWFGVTNLICSLNTADCYNPKVVQATMGSLARVSVIYEDITKVLKETMDPIYGGFMDGKSVYEEILPEKAYLVLGNEGNGISTEVEKLINNRIAIPQFGKFQKTESLNVATACSILLSEFKRPIGK